MILTTNKAQINMIFTFIVALLIIGAIVLIATKMLGGTFEDKCATDIIIFGDTFKESIRTNNDYGGVVQETYLAPCSYKTLCLVDAKAIDKHSSLDNADQDFPGATLIKNTVKDGVQTNVFLIDDQGLALDAGYAPQLALVDPNNVTCFNARQNKFTFIFTGQGKTTLVSKP
ncbi:hypothetical protein K9M74_02540 [Candidatus Woesearchaeota archaeon]|nr:hypothetical protein [Candidatus Woesearchaeota archaeon]